MIEKTTKKLQIETCLTCKISEEVLPKYFDLYCIMDKEKELKSELKGIDDKFACKESREKIENLYHNLYPSDSETDIEKKYQKLQELKKDKTSFDYIMTQEDPEIIEELANIFHLEGTVFQKYQILKKASENKLIDEGSTCLEKFQTILYAVDSLYDEERVTTLLQDKKTVLSCMHELNKKYEEDYQEKTGTNALKNFNRMTMETEENQEKVQKGIEYIYKKFMDSERHTYEVKGNRNCDAEMFLKVINEMNNGNKPVIDKFYRRIGRLRSDSQKIMMNYMQNAPKKFGDNLRRVMEIQDMSDTDVVKLFDTAKNAGAIKALRDTERTTLMEDQIAEICRTLLVSRDVLYKGVGKIYGNWMNLLDDEGLKIVEEKAKEMNVLIKEKTKSGIKKFIRSEIYELIHLNDEEFQKLVEDNPDLFEEKECCLYEDYECFDSLLNQEEAYTLLEVLEKLEKTEK